MLSKEQLLDEIASRLDERFMVEDPRPDPGVVNVLRIEEGVLVVQVGGPFFLIGARTAEFGVNG